MLEETITIPLSEYNGLKAQISELLKTVADLQQQLRLLRNGGKSDTSHTPPSHQIGAPNSRSLRQKTDRKTGGQPGHQGTTLELKQVPDETIHYLPPHYCNGCGQDLHDVIAVAAESRQEVVIPPIAARYIAHQSHSKVCSRCGKLCTAALPAHLTAPIQYGGSVGALVSYLSVYHYIPYHRMKVLLRDLFGLSISEGSIDNLLERTAQRALPAYNAIQRRVEQSEVVGSDETGTSFGGKKGWFHTWQTSCQTFIVASLNRGYQTIEQYFANGFPASVYVSDCWAAQLKVVALRHQLCMAHLLRELSNFENALSCSWSKGLKALFEEAIALKKQLACGDDSEPCIAVNERAVKEVERKLTQLLDTDLSATHKKVQALGKRLIKNRNSILTFLYHPKVPADNNGSERAIRNVKVKAKVSGQFRSERGATRFAILRSVIDTAIKNTQNVFEALTIAAPFQPE